MSDIMVGGPIQGELAFGDDGREGAGSGANLTMEKSEGIIWMFGTAPTCMAWPDFFGRGTRTLS